MVEKEVHSEYQFQNVGNQYFAVASANMITLAYGCISGWASPAISRLMSDDSPLQGGPISVEEASWVGSIICIGALLGTFSFGYITAMIGSMRSMCLIAIPALLHWIIIIFGTTVIHIYIARLIAGWTGGAISSCLILYVAEIADNRIRGTLGTINQISRNIGIVIAYIIGAYMQYEKIAFVFICLPIIFFVTFIYMPNTPQYLIQVGKLENAKKSLKYYKGCNNGNLNEMQALTHELDRLVLFTNQRKANEKLCAKDICQSKIIKQLLIGIMLTWFCVLSGTYTFMTYSVSIFEKSGTHIDANTSAIVLAIVQIIGVIITSHLVDKIGRKVLFIISLSGCTFCLTAMTVYLYLADHGFDMSAFYWVPVTALASDILISSVGINSLTFVYIVEILSPKIRTFGITVCNVTINSFSFFVVKYFPVLMHAINLYNCIAIFAINCAFGIIFVIFFVEETMGRDLDAMTDDDIENDVENVSVDKKN